MPYGVDKKMGGDNPSNTKFMESCVSSIKGTNKKTGKPYTKGEKIAICKAQLRKKHESNSSIEFTGIDNDIYEKIDSIRRFYIKQAIASKLATDVWDATLLYYNYLERINKDV